MQAYCRQHPVSLLPSLEEIDFVCPWCKGDLGVEAEAYHCPGCDRAYPLHGGIPDFRVFHDPYLNFQEDRERTEIVLGALDHHSLESLLEHYWSFSDVTPEALRPKFIRSAMMGEQRARRALSVIENGGQSPAHKRVLEVGSGTGNFLAVAAGRYQQVIGTDIAMRWLHVSRRRFMDAGLPVPPLVCCCAEYLPFPDGMFDLIVSSSTLEFTHHQEKVLSECARALKEGGMLYVNTVNRFSIAQNPYVYLWGVGFLPRAWQARYVRWRRQASYENIRLLSVREINRMAAGRFSSPEFHLPEIDPAALRRFSRSTRMQARVYMTLTKWPLVNLLLKWVGPGWDIMLRKGPKG